MGDLPPPIRYDGIPMAQVTIHVPPRPYQARIENGLLARSGTLLAELLPQASKVFVVTAPPIRRRWGAKLLRSLTAAGFKPQVIQMPDGEPAKKLRTVEIMAERLSRLGADRKAVLIALGGGVVGDVTGLLASLYMRGVELVQIPTTFLAQVDASIGGKTAVNLGAGKNLLGTYHHPRAVLIDPELLQHALRPPVSRRTLRISQVRHHRRRRSIPALRAKARTNSQTRPS